MGQRDTENERRKSNKKRRSKEGIGTDDERMKLKNTSMRKHEIKKRCRFSFLLIWRIYDVKHERWARLLYEMREAVICLVLLKLEFFSG